MFFEVLKVLEDFGVELVGFGEIVNIVEIERRTLWSSLLPLDRVLTRKEKRENAHLLITAHLVAVGKSITILGYTLRDDLKPETHWGNNVCYIAQ